MLNENVTTAEFTHFDETPASNEIERRTQSIYLQERLRQARRAFSTHRVVLGDVRGLKRQGTPRAGDLILARVVRIGQHTKLESPEGRRQTLYPGDEIIVAYGNRYAPDQFDAVVPADLSPCDLVAGGGIAAHMRAKHAGMKAPTQIEPVGLLIDQHRHPINLSAYRLSGQPTLKPQCKVIAVVGTSMNAGKTTAAASIIRGLTLAGLHVGAAKVTGTGSGGDIWSMIDAGARVALDFTDMGYATTAGCDLEQLAADSLALIAHVSEGNDAVVIEIADGLFQRETAGLLQCPSFAAAIDRIVLAAGDAMGAAFGADWLRKRNLPLGLLAGCVSASPLGLREASTATGLKVVTRAQLSDPINAPAYCFDDAALRPAFCC